MAECEVARTDDLGKNDIRFHTITHLGHVLKCGDEVLGFDLTSSQIVEENVENQEIPDVVLVQKVYSEKRIWKIKAVEDVEDGDEKLGGSKKKGKKAYGDQAEAEARDMDTFMRELDGDKEMRGKMNLYKDRQKMEALEAQQAEAGASMDNNEDDEKDEEAVQLDELLDDLDDLQLDDTDALPDEVAVFASAEQAPSETEAITAFKNEEEKPFIFGNGTGH